MNPIEEKIRQTLAESSDNVALRCGIKGLTEEDVREGKTPEGIARLWLSRMLGHKTDRTTLEQEERDASKKHFPLLPYSQLVYDMEQQYPGVYMFRIGLRYDKQEIDTFRLNTAIQAAISNHPVFRGNEKYYDIKAEDGLLNLTINRILGDGYSYGILLEDICKSYQGLSLAPDYYFRYLQQAENRKESESFKAHRHSLEEIFSAVDGNDIPVRPTLDKLIEPDDEWQAGEYVLPLDWTPDNETVCLATAIAIMDYCHTDQAALTWAYLGRENEQERHIFGSLHKDIPMLIHRAETREAYRQQVKNQIQQGILMSDYPYTLTDPQHKVWQYAVNVLQQPRPEDINLHGLHFQVDIPSELQRSCNGETPMAYSLLDIEIAPHQLRFKYSATHYKPSTIHRFAEMIKKNI